MVSENTKDTATFDIRKYSVGLEKVYFEEKENLSRRQSIHKAIELLKTWRSVYRELEDETPFRPVFSVIDALQEDQFDE